MLRWFTRHLFPPRPRVQAATAQLERYAVARAVLSQFGAFLVRASDRESTTTRRAGGLRIPP